MSCHRDRTGTVYGLLCVEAEQRGARQEAQKEKHPGYPDLLHRLRRSRCVIWKGRVEKVGQTFGDRKKSFIGTTCHSTIVIHFAVHQGQQVLSCSFLQVPRTKSRFQQAAPNGDDNCMRPVVSP